MWRRFDRYYQPIWVSCAAVMVVCMLVFIWSEGDPRWTGYPSAMLSGAVGADMLLWALVWGLRQYRLEQRWLRLREFERSRR